MSNIFIDIFKGVWPSLHFGTMLIKSPRENLGLVVVQTKISADKIYFIPRIFRILFLYVHVFKAIIMKIYGKIISVYLKDVFNLMNLHASIVVRVSDLI